MNAVMLTPSFAPDIGGVECHVQAVADRIAARGHIVTIITQMPPSAPEGLEPLETLESGVGVRRLNFNPPGSMSMGFAPGALITQLPLLAEADLVHCHDLGTFIRWYNILRIAMWRKKVFITFHGYEGFPIKSRAVILRRISRKLVAGTINVGGYLEKWYRTPADFVIIGGVDAPGQIKPLPSEPRGLFLGRVAPYNGIGGYLRTLVELKRLLGQAPPLNIVGPGRLEPSWAEMIHFNSLPVTTQGPEADPGPSIDHGSFVFAGGYLSVLESMARIRPVFALADNPLRKDYFLSLPDAREILTLAESPGSLAGAVRDYLQNPAPFLAKAQRALEWARTRTWDQVADIYLQLWSLSKISKTMK